MENVYRQMSQLLLSEAMDNRANSRLNKKLGGKSGEGDVWGIKSLKSSDILLGIQKFMHIHVHAQERHEKASS